MLEDPPMLPSDEASLFLLTPDGELTSTSRGDALGPFDTRTVARRVRSELGTRPRCDFTLTHLGLQVTAWHMVAQGKGMDSVLVAVARVPGWQRETDLTSRQLEIAQHAALGATVGEIGVELRISPHTVRTHLRDIYRRLGISSRVELANLVHGQAALAIGC